MGEHRTRETDTRPFIVSSLIVLVCSCHENISIFLLNASFNDRSHAKNVLKVFVSNISQITVCWVVRVRMCDKQLAKREMRDAAFLGCVREIANIYLVIRLDTLTERPGRTDASRGGVICVQRQQ